jgi:HD-GYP domain-containing protein (c-di-GMP phosphodiesterase class II)/DNA-binding CsgD family transcriptional regulator
MEPQSPFRYFDSAKLDDAASAFGDFADLKSFYSAGHSRRVASLAESTANAMDLDAAAITDIRRAALVHDIGLVAIPSFVLHKPADRLSEAESEMIRLHPYHAERILARAPAFAPLREIVAAHHERSDGHGYFRGLGERDIPNGAAILAAADHFDELTHDGPERPAYSPEDALAFMSRETGRAFSGTVLAALRLALHATPAETSAEDLHQPAVAASGDVRARWPAGLTDREVEVLRLLSTGARRSEMAAKLSVSEHTIRHHLSHIYTKIDVRTRVEATLFAIENGLLP